MTKAPVQNGQFLKIYFYRFQQHNANCEFFFFASNTFCKLRHLLLAPFEPNRQYKNEQIIKPGNKMFLQLLKHLNATVLFTADEFEALTALMQPKQLKKKEYLFMNGDIARYVGFVNKGCLRYYCINNKAREHILYFAFEEWWIGDLQSFYSNEPSENNLQALENCELFLMNVTAFEKAKEAIPSFQKFTDIKFRNAYTASQLKHFETKSEPAEEKYRKLLKQSPGILQRIPQHYIASYLDITPESLSRIRKKIASK